MDCLKKEVVARMDRPTTFQVAGALAFVLLVVATGTAHASVLYQTGFEDFAAGTTLGAGGGDGFVLTGTGTSATVTSAPAFARQGLQGVQLQTPGAKTQLYYPTPIANTFKTSVTASIDLAIKNATTDADRGAFAGLAMYDTAGAEIATVQLTWDRDGTLRGGPENTYYIQYQWHESATDAAFHGLTPPYTINSVSAASLNGIGFTNLSITVDYNSKQIFFGLDQVPEENVGTFSSFAGFGYASIYYGIEAAGTTAPLLAADNLVISKIFTGIQGDYNNDGYVDAADYTVWADNFGRTGPSVPGDGNSDGRVDAADYTVWADHFGQGSPPSGLASVPEPAGATTLGLASLMLVRRRR